MKYILYIIIFHKDADVQVGGTGSGAKQTLTPIPPIASIAPSDCSHCTARQYQHSSPGEGPTWV